MLYAIARRFMTVSTTKASTEQFVQRAAEPRVLAREIEVSSKVADPDRRSAHQPLRKIQMLTVPGVKRTGSVRLET